MSRIYSRRWWEFYEESLRSTHTHTHTHTHTASRIFNIMKCSIIFTRARTYILTYLSVNALFMNACIQVWIDFVTRVHSPFSVPKSEDCVRLSDGYKRHVNKLLVRRRLVCVCACMCVCVRCVCCTSRLIAKCKEKICSSCHEKKDNIVPKK